MTHGDELLTRCRRANPAPEDRLPPPRLEDARRLREGPYRRITPRRRRRVLATVPTLVGAAAIVGLLAVALPRGDSPTGGPGIISTRSTAPTVTTIPKPSALPTPSQPVPTAEAIDPALVSAFGVFRRAATTTDHVPSDQVETLLGLGANPSLARAVKVGDARAFLVPTSTGLCLTLDGGGGCTTTEVAVNGALVGSDICAQAGQGPMTVYGLLPDGARDVVVHFTDGSSEPVSPVDNVYGISVSRTPVPSRVTWSMNGGDREVSVPTPPGATQASC